MSQNDLVIANQTFPATRADINSALQALGSNNSGSSAPTTTYANMLWYDTGTNILKMRAEANDAWINVAYLDQSTDAFRILDDTQVVNTSGTQTGLLGDQSTATWEAGTGTTQSLVSPANIKAAITANSPAPSDPIGVNQTFTSFSNGGNTSYQNSTGRPIQVVYTASGGAGYGFSSLQVSSNNSTWVTVGSQGGGPNDQDTAAITTILPSGYYYRGDKAGTMVLLS
jgi:hypothetical protein